MISNFIYFFFFLSSIQYTFGNIHDHSHKLVVNILTLQNFSCTTFVCEFLTVTNDTLCKPVQRVFDCHLWLDNSYSLIVGLDLEIVVLVVSQVIL